MRCPYFGACLLEELRPGGGDRLPFRQRDEHDTDVLPPVEPAIRQVPQFAQPPVVSLGDDAARIEERHRIAGAAGEPVIEEAFAADLPADEQVVVEDFAHAPAQLERWIGEEIWRDWFRHGSVSLSKRGVNAKASP